MKERIKRILSLLIFTLICFIPIKVDAASLNINVSATKVKPNTNVTLNIAASGFTNGFGSMTFTVKYDTSKFSFVSSKHLQGTSVSSNNNGTINVTIESDGGETGIKDGEIYQIVLKSNNSTGTSNIVISSSDCWTPDGTTSINVSGNTKTITHYTPSTVNTLKSLSVKGCTLSPKFNTNTTNYTCSETKESSITVNAEATDNTASISGTGKKTLKVGENKISITVTSESGSKKVYNITVNKIDNRNGDNTLASLTIANHAFDFNKDVLEYTVNVNEEVANVNIFATPTNEKSTVTGAGNKTLNEGLNKIIIKVTAENGMTKDYTLNIVRAAKENIPSTTLTELKIDGKILDVNNNVFLVGVENSTSKANIEYKTTSTTTTYEVIGNETLTAGISLVTITVKDMGCEDKTYTLIIYKNEYKKIENLSEISSINSNSFYSIKENETHIIYKSMNDVLKNSNYKFVYNVVNDNDGLIYSLTLDNNIALDKDLEPVFSRKDNDSTIFNSNIPANIKINAYVGNELDEKYYLYSNDNGKQILISEVNVNNGYIEFTSNGSESYLLSKEKITIQENTNSNNGKEMFTRIQYLLVGFVCGVIGTLIVKNIKIEKKKKEVIRPIEKL